VRSFFTLGVFCVAISLCACGGGGGGAGASAVPQAAATVANQGGTTISSASGSIVLSPVANSVTGIIAPGTASVTVAALSTAEVANAGTLALENMGIALAAAAPQAHAVQPLAVAPAAARSSGQPQLAVERFAAEDPATLRAALAHLVTTQGAAAARRAQSLPTAVGATSSLWIQASSLGAAAGAYAQLPAVLAAVTAHGYIWIDSSLSGVIASPATVAAIANDFENAYATDTAHFGTAQYTTAAPGYAAFGSVRACDSSGNPTGQSTPVYIDDSDPRVAVFVVNTHSLGSGIGGYFTSANFWTTAAANCTIGTANAVRTNAAPMIYVGYEPSLPAGFPANYEVAEDMVRATAHELQHLISAIHHVILTNGSLEDPWINEGLSMLAQDLAVPRTAGTSNDVDDAVTHASRYLTAPQNYSITGFSGIDPPAWGGTGSLQFNCPNCYGAEYLFQRYLFDRFGGDAYLQAVESGGVTGYTNLSNATQESLASLLAEFGVALAASNTGITTDPKYVLAGLNLQGTLKDQFGNSVALSGPRAAGSLSPGGNMSVGAYLGTYLYLNVTGVGTSGATIRIDDPAGLFGLRAAIVHR